MISASLRAYIHGQEECLTLSHCCPGFFVSLSQNISQAEKRNKDDWQLGAKSHQLLCWQPGDVHTLLMCRRVTADWQRGWETGRWSRLRTPAQHTLFMQRSQHRRCHLNPFVVRHPLPVWEGTCWPGLQAVALPWVLPGSHELCISEGEYKSSLLHLHIQSSLVHVKKIPNYFHFRYQEIFQWDFFTPY